MPTVPVRGFRRRNPVNPGTHRVRPSVRKVSERSKQNYNHGLKVRYAKYPKVPTSKIDFAVETAAKQDFVDMAFRELEKGRDVLDRYNVRDNGTGIEMENVFYATIRDDHYVPSHLIYDNNEQSVTLDLGKESKSAIDDIFEIISNYYDAKYCPSSTDKYDYSYEEYKCPYTGKQRYKIKLYYKHKKDYDTDVLFFKTEPFAFKKGAF